MPQHTSMKKHQIYNSNLNNELFLPLMLIKITDFPGNMVKFVPSQSSLAVWRLHCWQNASWQKEKKTTNLEYV